MKEQNSRWKIFLTMLLVIIMIGSSLDLSFIASAEAKNIATDGGLGRTESDRNLEQAEIIELEEWYLLGETETSAMAMSLFSLDDGKVELKNTNEAAWIDRIADMPDEIRAFYDTLVEGSDNDGVDDILIEDSYFAMGSIDVVTVTGTLSETTDTALIAAMNDVVNRYALYISAAYCAFDRDHPEVFWLSGQWAIGVRGSRIGTDYTVTVTFTLKYEDVNNTANNFDLRVDAYQSETVIKKAINDRDSLVNSMMVGTSNQNTYNKVKYFNELLTKFNEYNSIVSGGADVSVIAHDCLECISALVGSEGALGPVCEGYARAFKVLCDEVGIPCVLVDGTAYRSSTDSIGEAHMWNYVQLDGKWYAVDVTWNDPVVTPGVASGEKSGFESEDWLLVGSDTVINDMKFLDSHPVSNQVSSHVIAFTNGPELSASAYVREAEEVPAEYKVEYYLMNLDGETYELAETVTVPFTGVFGDEVYGEVKNYEGFAAPEQQSIIITDNEEYTIRYYYTRNKYYFSTNIKNGEGWIDITGTSPDGYYYYGETINLNAVICDKPADAYVLNGWTCGDVHYEPNDSFSMPASNYLVAVLDCATKTYIIHYDANGGTGTIPDSAEISYLDEYVLASGSELAWENHEFRGWSTTPVEPGNYPMFDYFPNQTVSKLTTDDSITLYAVWHDYQPTTFTVKHYVESIDSKWVLEKTEIVDGFATNIYTADELMDSDFIVDKYTYFRGMSENGYEVTLFSPKADGSSVIELYYNRITFHIDLTFYAWDDAGKVCNQVEIAGDFFAGQKVKVEHWFTDGKNYTLDSWDYTAGSEIEFTQDGDVLYFNMPTEDVVLDVYYWQEGDLSDVPDEPDLPDNPDEPDEETDYYSLSAEFEELTVGDTVQLLFYINGLLQEADLYGDYLWTTDSDTVVQVAEDGTVTGLGVGTAIITCTSKADAEVKASCALNIRIPFADIKVTDWQYPFVVYAYENNLMSGTSENTFDMNGKLTRSQFVTVLYSYAGKPPVTFETYFPDVAEGIWYSSPVIWAKNEGVTAGLEDGTFGVDNNITREQLVVMLYQYAKNTGVVSGTIQGDLSTYPDEAKVSSWAKEALIWAVQNGIISGKDHGGVNYLDPGETTTRGECATMMMRFVELAK